MKYPTMTQLAKRLIYIRKIHDLSQVELAQKAGTTQQAIQQAETGKARQPRYLHQLASALDIPLEWMIFGKAQDAPLPRKTGKKGLEDKSADVLDNFFAMPAADQKLIYELIKSRQKK